MITLERAKQHCQVDFADDDDIITSYIAAAHEYMSMQMSRKIYAEGDTIPDTDETGIHFNAAIGQAVLLTVGHWYANRESVVVGTSASELPEGAWRLIQPYRIMGV